LRDDASGLEILKKVKRQKTTFFRLSVFGAGQRVFVSANANQQGQPSKPII
jgi:hypothetical protein